MKNYIVINGVTYDLVKRQNKVCVPGSGLVAGPKLSTIPAADTFKVGKYEFVVLEQSGDTTAVILRSALIDKTVFGKNNNYDGSNVDTECNRFADEIAGLVGKENLMAHTVDLTSDDGLKDYGKIRRLASALTADRYRRYVEILDKHKLKQWWWLATPYSTKRHEDNSLVKCVAPSGLLISGDCFNGRGGVRPFCIFKSSIFESK